jgi:hypothetical protein
MEHNNPDEVSTSPAPTPPEPTTPAPAATPGAEDRAPTASPDIVNLNVLAAWEHASARDSYMEDATRVAGDGLAHEVRRLRGKIEHLELEARTRRA